MSLSNSSENYYDSLYCPSEVENQISFKQLINEIHKKDIILSEINDHIYNSENIEKIKNGEIYLCIESLDYIFDSLFFYKYILNNILNNKEKIIIYIEEIVKWYFNEFQYSNMKNKFKKYEEQIVLSTTLHNNYFKIKSEYIIPNIHRSNNIKAIKSYKR